MDRRGKKEKKVFDAAFAFRSHFHFLGTRYQNQEKIYQISTKYTITRKKYTRCPQNTCTKTRKNIPDVHKIYQNQEKYTRCPGKKYTRCPQNTYTKTRKNIPDVHEIYQTQEKIYQIFTKHTK
jgi:hypothetical protein